MKKDINEWWAHLKTTEKERIARKASGKELPYPECTQWWLDAEEEKKLWIYNHCTNSHGLVQGEWVDESEVNQSY